MEYQKKNECLLFFLPYVSLVNFIKNCKWITRAQGPHHSLQINQHNKKKKELYIVLYHWLKQKNIISFLRIDCSLFVKRWVLSLKDALFYVMFEWSWLSGSGEEETMKCLQTDRYTSDNRQSEKLIWGWSSGEQIRSTIARLDC